MRQWSFLVLMSFLIHPVVSLAGTVCTMTFNSPDEKEALRKIYEPQGVQFVELVPTSRVDTWLDNACRSKIQCDVLLISGHFGGLFFGETSGLSLSLPELEQAACREDCRGLFQNPKDVFLLGCNTLAGKKRDHRTFEQYVQVLVADGFDRELAESVAITRYQELGLSIQQRFQSIFNKTPRIHGFNSTGPLGPQLAPLLAKSLKGHSSRALIESGAPVERLKKQLAGLSYVVVDGRKSDIAASEHRQLTCESQRMTEDHFGYLLQQEFFLKHYESILAAISNQPLFRMNFVNWLQKDMQRFKKIDELLSLIYKKSPSRLGLRLTIIDVKRKMGLIDFSAFMEAKKGAFIEQLSRSLKDGLDYQEAEQICSQKKHLSDLSFDLNSLSGNSATKRYLNRIHQCLKEDLKFSRYSWYDLVRLESVDLNVCLSQVQANQHASANSRDGSRWSCINKFEPQMKTLNECLIVYDQFEDQAESGFGWTCLKSFEKELTVESCLKLASANADVSNADDMLWSCWTKLRYRSNFQRSDCLALSVGMKIYGNRLKMNWNCQNRIQE